MTILGNTPIRKTWNKIEIKSAIYKGTEIKLNAMKLILICMKRKIGKNSIPSMISGQFLWGFSWTPFLSINSKFEPQLAENARLNRPCVHLYRERNCYIHTQMYREKIDFICIILNWQNIFRRKKISWAKRGKKIRIEEISLMLPLFHQFRRDSFTLYEFKKKIN